MKRQLAKVFRKNNNLAAFEYDGDNYYCFVKSLRNQDFSQVIITSEIMLYLLSSYFVHRKFSVVNIELLTEDKDLEEQIKRYIKDATADREKVAVLLSELSFLVEENSIDIKKIEMSNKKDTTVFFQVNGLFGVSADKYTVEKDFLLSKISEQIYV